MKILIERTEIVNIVNILKLFRESNKNIDSLDNIILVENILIDYANSHLNKDESNITAFENITSNMLDTYIKKNHDYGSSFDKSLDKFGIIAGIVRLGDKINRIESLATKDQKVNDESIQDTLLDLANYAIMTLMWLKLKENNNEKV